MIGFSENEPFLRDLKCRKILGKNEDLPQVIAHLFETYPAHHVIS
jgi:hypothetical protein